MEKVKKPAEERPVVFGNRRGQKLFGVLHLPREGGVSPIAVMAHGFTDDKTGDNRLFVIFARAAAAAGIAVLRFDFAGSGDSEGDFSRLTLSSEIEDLSSAVDYAGSLAELDPAKINLIGYSLGGAVSIMYAVRDPRIRSVIGWAPVSSPCATFQRILGKDAFSSQNGNDLRVCERMQEILLTKGFLQRPRET